MTKIIIITGIAVVSLALNLALILKWCKKPTANKVEAEDLILEEHKIQNHDVSFSRKSELMQSRRIRLNKLVKDIEDNMAS